MDSWHILDFSAIANHCINSGEGAEFEYDAISGRKVNTAEHGFANFIDLYLNPILEIAQPHQIIAVHDGGCEFREFIFPDYKKKRNQKKAEESDGEYARQLERCKTLMTQMLTSLGILQCKVKGVEGDDLMAYLVQGLWGNVRIYTVDADMLQLLSDKVQVFIKNIWINPEALDEESAPNMAVYLHDLVGASFPKYITLYKSLVGDASDEYNGITGFGDGMFRDMTNEIETDGLDQLLECLDTQNFTALENSRDYYLAEGIKEPKWLTMILGNLQQWKLCYRLACLHPLICERPWRNRVTKIQWFKRVPNQQRLEKTLKDARCFELVEDYARYMPQTWLIDANNFEDGDIAEFTELCRKSAIVAFDYESADAQHENFQIAANGRGHVDIITSKPTGVSFCLGENLENCFYITVDHKNSANLPEDIIAKFLQAIPEETTLVAQNAFFEMCITQNRYDLMLENVHDTMIMAKYVDEDESSGLKTLSKTWLNYDQLTYKETIAQAGIENATMRDITAQQVLKYGVDDSIVTGHLYHVLRVIMMLEHTWGFYIENEPPTTNTLVYSYLNGQVFDWEVQRQIKENDERTSKEAENRLREILDANCGELNPDYLKAFLKVEDHNWRAIARDKYKDLPNERFKELGGTREEILPNLVRDFVDSQGEKFAKLSVYTPYREDKIYPDVKPTVKTLNKVCEALGLPELATLSVRNVKEWSMSIGLFSFDGDSNTLTDEQRQFADKLNAALSMFKDRVGKPYDDFINFCKPYLELKPKIVKSGTELNMSSPQQVQALLYVILGLPVRLHSKPQNGSVRSRLKLKGSPATDAIAVDTALAEDVTEGDWRYEALQCVKIIKDAETRISLYHNTYPLWKHPDTDLVYPQIRNFGTVTGRPTGSCPNVLQVSKHQMDGVMRSIYLPRYRDHCMVAIDFNGQELRLLASVTKDRNLLASYLGAENADLITSSPETVSWSFKTEDVIFRNDLSDVHSMTASGMTHIFGLPRMNYGDYINIYNDESHEHHKAALSIRKRPAKQTNFLLTYGGTAPTLATRLIIPEKQAQLMMDSTHATYPNIKKWQKSSAEFARRNGYTVTAYGKRRHINQDIFSKENGLKNRMERQVNNAEIQGTAADILKIVLGECWKRGVWQETGAYMLAPVYDEVVASVPFDKVVRYVALMRSIMNITPKGQPVPMAADVSIGHNWQSQIELGMSPTEDAINEVIEQIRPKVEAKWDSLNGKFKDE
ncbi:hypothetical protein RBG11_004236 [Vibrio parahaemolyticus]|nr:hypothetical protein [Vibrio parahaemolyticus]